MGIGEGLPLLWSDDVELSISSFSSRHIDAMVKNDQGILWHFTKMYGDPVTSNKNLFLDFLRQLDTRQRSEENTGAA